MSDPVEYIINVKNSVLLYGTYNENLNLTNDQEYLVSDNLILYGDAVLTIEPGTVIKVSDNKRITFLENSKMICEGLNTSYIYWQAENVGWSGFGFGGDRSSIKYTHISGMWSYNVNGQSFFGTSNAFDVEKSIITDNRAYYLINSNGHSIKTSNIYENWIESAAYYPSQNSQHKGVTKSNFISNYN